MKYILLFLALYLPISAFAQKLQPREKIDQIDANLKLLRDDLQAEVAKRNPHNPAFTEPSGTATFKQVYKKVFSTVVLGKTDLVTNGSAFSYSQDNNKSTFSINGAKAFEKLENTIFDGGLSLKSKDNSYAYYQKGKWSNDITIKLGVAIKLCGKKAYYTKEAASEANKFRAAFFDNEYQKFAQLLKVNTSIVSDTTQLNILAKDLRNESAQFTKINDAYGKSDNAAKPFHGYRIFWANINLSYTNASFSVENDSVIAENIQEKYSSVSKFTIEGNLNFHLKGINNFFITQVYGRFNRGSILDNVDLIDKKVKVSPLPIDNEYSLYYYDKVTGAVSHFGNYSDIHAPVLTVDYGLYLAYLRPWKQQLGINAKVNFTTPYDNNEYRFERNYSVLFGPIIRLMKDQLFSAVTFTLNTGFENAKYNENAWDKLVVKVSAAIPFNVFEKSNK